MSRWQDNYKQHQVHKTINDVLITLKDSAFKKADAKTEQEIARIKKCIELTKEVLANSDQEFIAQTQLNQINQYVVQVNQHLNNFKSNQSISELEASNANLDLILGILANIAAISLPKGITSEVSISSLIKRGEDFLVILDKRKKELQQQIAGLKTSSTSLEKQLTGLQNRIDEKTTALDQLASEWTQLFNTKETERDNNFRELLTQIENDATSQIKTIIDNYEAHISSTNSEYNENIKELIVDAKERHEKIKELHGLVAEDSITGGHKSSAGVEQKSANTWRRWTLCIFGLATLWLAIVFFNAAEISLESSLAGFPVTLVLLSAAGFTAIQSNRHRRNANRQNQFYLEMTAIDPYLENLGEEERIEIKKELAAKYFGHVFDEQKQKANKDSVEIPKSVADAFVKYITKSGE